MPWVLQVSLGVNRICVQAGHFVPLTDVSIEIGIDMRGHLVCNNI